MFPQCTISEAYHCHCLHSQLLWLSWLLMTQAEHGEQMLIGTQVWHQVHQRTYMLSNLCHSRCYGLLLPCTLLSGSKFCPELLPVTNESSLTLFFFNIVMNIWLFRVAPPSSCWTLPSPQAAYQGLYLIVRPNRSAINCSCRYHYSR